VIPPEVFANNGNNNKRIEKGHTIEASLRIDFPFQFQIVARIPFSISPQAWATMIVILQRCC